MEDRITQLNSFSSTGNVLYLMKRDQRIHQNHSITLAYTLSHNSKSKMYIGMELDKIKMNKAQKRFILEGILEMIEDCKDYNLSISNIDDLDEFLDAMEIKAVVLDFNPMREYTKRQKEIEGICEKKKIALFVCDSHNIVPCKLLKVYKRTPMSVRAELYKIWDIYLKDYTPLEPHKYNSGCVSDQAFFSEELKKTQALPKCEFVGGYSKGMAQLNAFFKERFQAYNTGRNNPEINVLSDLSPYLHTGQISPLAVVLMAMEKFGKSGSENYQAFIGEVFIWRETAEHFVYHEKNYDNIRGALPWARETLMFHSQDSRPKIYSREDLEAARTDDPLWNAAQKQMLKAGKMHGYVRMYWAKTILKWLEDPREALKIAIELNDEYSIDGNDPNGYLGVMWCICGSMDRGFGEREILGKIRSMKPIKCPLYISKWNSK